MSENAPAREFIGIPNDFTDDKKVSL